jgi:two-component system OmpR family sensor kinase/two-component system sensor histidine kinase BaeS
MRRHFARRIVFMLVPFFGLVFAASALAVALLSGAFGVERDGGLVVPAAILGLLLLTAAFALVGRTLRRTARPIGDVMEAADRVAGGDYSARVRERGPGELRRLARSFNTMAERLEAGEDVRRNLLADVAHELRTPLSVIQGDVEGMLDGLYPSDPAHLQLVLEETKVMSRLLEDLQTLSTAEAGALPLHRQLVEPEELVADAVAASRTRADAAKVALSTRVAPVLPRVDVDPVRIGEVFANLLLNAIRHTPPGGSVEVAAERADDGRVAFVVHDTGRGIDPRVLPHVFDRFVKAAGSGGAGLGLAIARSLIQAHGGRITADTSPREGTTMRFLLPASPLR